MSKTYFVNKYDDMFIELFSKKTDWKKIENIKDISGEIDFCYNVDNNDKLDDSTSNQVTLF